MMSVKAVFHEPPLSAWVTISERDFPFLMRRENGTVLPLYRASFNGILPAVKLLLADANINIVGGRYGTAIQAAAAERYQDIVEILIQAKADVNIVGGWFGTAIQAAAARGSRDIVEMLIQAKADVNIVGGTYGMAIQAAAAGGNQDIVEMLIQAKADVNIVGGKYGMAIQAAFGYRQSQFIPFFPSNISLRAQAVVELLIEAGANPNGISNYPNHDNKIIKSPIRFSEDCGWSGVVQLLLNAGAEDDCYLDPKMVDYWS